MMDSIYHLLVIVLIYHNFASAMWRLWLVQNQNCLLVIRQNDNHSPGPGPGRLVPSSHQRSELSNTILGTFSRGDKRVWKCIPIPNGLGGGVCVGGGGIHLLISVLAMGT